MSADKKKKNQSKSTNSNKEKSNKEKKRQEKNEVKASESIQSRATNLRGSLRPMVLGDDTMALRLHAYFMSDESFNLFDMKSMFDKSYEPNLILFFGPLKADMKTRIKELRAGLGSHKLIFIQDLCSPEEEEEAAESAKSLEADFVLAKRFPTLENIKEMIERAADV